MTRDELKDKLTPILCDLSLTTKERANKLGPIFIEFLPESIRLDDKESETLQVYADIWNTVIYEVVWEHQLG